MYYLKDSYSIHHSNACVVGGGGVHQAVYTTAMLVWGGGVHQAVYTTAMLVCGGGCTRQYTSQPFNESRPPTL